MNRSVGIGLAALICLLTPLAYGGTIYTWTDENGVKRYSNAQPPEDAEQVRTIEEVRTDPAENDRLRQEYERMVEEASREADRYLKEQAEKKALEEEATRNQQAAEQSQRVEAERNRLLKEMEAIQNRGLGPTFTLGMKENLIRQIQEQIEQLEASVSD